MNNSSIFPKILTGINSTLNLANKALPLYQQSKPMIQTISKTYKNIKNNKSDLSNMIKLMKLKNTIKKDINKNSINITNKSTNLINNKTYSNINNPKFFL